MQLEDINLPTYKCHKVVQAAKIGKIEGNIIYFVDSGYAAVDVSAEFMEAHNFNQSCYLVLYPDGYMSVSPASAFESGYTKINDYCELPAASEKSIEQEIQAKGLTAPRITPTDIDAAIAQEQYFIFPDTTLTICCLTLQNGFQVTGESACASLANFDKEIGRKIARDNAKQKIWALEGYLLKSKLAELPL